MARKVSRERLGGCWAGLEWEACSGGYHAMRHVRVTSRGRSREHRVLPITCPVTRSLLHPYLSISVASPPSPVTPLQSLVLLSRRRATSRGYSFRALILHAYMNMFSLSLSLAHAREPITFHMRIPTIPFVPCRRDHNVMTFCDSFDFADITVPR